MLNRFSPQRKWKRFDFFRQEKREERGSSVVKQRLPQLGCMVHEAFCFSRMFVQSMMTAKQPPCYGVCTVLSPRGKVPKVAGGNIRETGMGRHVPPGPPRPPPTRCRAQRRRSVLISFSEQGYGQCGPPIRVACAICSPSFVCGVRKRDLRE